MAYRRKLGLVLSMFLVLGGCGDEEGGECTFASDCPAGQYCSGGRCGYDCVYGNNSTCPVGYMCSANGQCLSGSTPTGDGGMGDVLLPVKFDIYSPKFDASIPQFDVASPQYDVASVKYDVPSWGDREPVTYDLDPGAGDWPGPGGDGPGRADWPAGTDGPALPSDREPGTGPDWVEPDVVLPDMEGGVCDELEDCPPGFRCNYVSGACEMDANYGLPGGPCDPANPASCQGEYECLIPWEGSRDGVCRMRCDIGGDCPDGECCIIDEPGGEAYCEQALEGGCAGDPCTQEAPVCAGAGLVCFGVGAGGDEYIWECRYECDLGDPVCPSGQECLGEAERGACIRVSYGGEACLTSHPENLWCVEGYSCMTLGPGGYYFCTKTCSSNGDCADMGGFCDDRFTPHYCNR